MFLGEIPLGSDDFTSRGTELISIVTGAGFRQRTRRGCIGQGKAINATTAFLQYRQVRTSLLRGTFGHSAARDSNAPSRTASAAIGESSSWTANLFYSALAKLDIRAEYQHASRRFVSGVSTDLSRLGLTVENSF